MSELDIIHGPGWEIAVADTRAAMAKLPADSVHCAVTSPPYWGLRDYGVAGQIGLESSIADWIRAMLEVTAAVHRVLRPDGTFWVNMGDAYAQGGRGPGGPAWDAGHNSNREARAAQKTMGDASRRPPAGVKHKDLLGLPWELAFAMRAQGWYLRGDIIWSKKNPMPESIRDRPTKAHEYLFLFAKSEVYFYDNEAVREPYAPASLARRAFADTNVGDRRSGHQPGTKMKPPEQDHAYLGSNPGGRNLRDVWSINSERFKEKHFATFPTKLVEPCLLAGTSEKGVCPACGAPWRRFLVKGAPDIDRQVAAGGDDAGEYHGTSEKHDGAAPFRQSQNPSRGVKDPQNASEVKARILAGMRVTKATVWRPTCGCSPRPTPREIVDDATLTYPDEPRCADPRCGHFRDSHGRDQSFCGHCKCRCFRAGDPYEPIPATVLDPFSGAATTGIVATRLGRRYLGCELSPKYAEISRRRLEEDLQKRTFQEGFGRQPASPAEEKAMASQLSLFAR